MIDIAMLKVHPKNTEIYGEEDVTALRQSIAESGWIRPLTVTPEYVIVSGHRRYQAAKQLGYTELPVEFETFASEEAELERLLRENENRGKTFEQKIREGMTWEDVESIKDRRGGDRRSEDFQTRNISSLKGNSYDIIACRVDLGSGKTYEKGKAVVERIDREFAMSDILHYGEILRTQLNGQSITAAWNTLDNIVKAQEKAEREAKKKEAEKLRQQELARQRYLEAVKKAEHCTLYHCSVSDLSQFVEPESIDCIITDPPYPREFLPVYRDLAKFASYALKPGGSLIVMIGQSYLLDILQEMNVPGLLYRWTCAYLTPGPATQLHQRHIQCGWKPLLWYTKGECEGMYIHDVFHSNSGDKSKHDWGQSQSGIEDIMGRVTRPGELVCDPFVGGGATAVVAMEMERRFVGCDIDEICVVSLEEKKASMVEKVMV
jgi:ParB-like chromosome segregation protein Spo0J